MLDGKPRASWGAVFVLFALVGCDEDSFEEQDPLPSGKADQPYGVESEDIPLVWYPEGDGTGAKGIPVGEAGFGFPASFVPDLRMAFEHAGHLLEHEFAWTIDPDDSLRVRLLEVQLSPDRTWSFTNRAGVNTPSTQDSPPALDASFEHTIAGRSFRLSALFRVRTEDGDQTMQFKLQRPFHLFSFDLEAKADANVTSELREVA